MSADSHTLKMICHAMKGTFHPEGGTIEFPFNVEVFCEENDRHIESLEAQLAEAQKVIEEQLERLSEKVGK